MMKLFQVIKVGSLWGVYAVNADDPNDRLLVANSLTEDENYARDWVANLTRIAATHCPNTDDKDETDETDGVDLTAELGIFDRPLRRIRVVR
jgi:hypothetical protein